MRVKNIVLVGEAFGQEEDKYQRCFIGRAGQLLNKALAECGLERHEVHVTNVCMFRPIDELGGNRPPTEEEIANQRERLIADVKGFNKVVLLGATAHNALHPLGGRVPMSSVLGSTMVKDSRSFVTLYHPAYILRNINKYGEWVEMMKEALNA